METYNTLLRALRDGGQADQAIHILALMNCSSVQPDLETYKILMTMFEEKGNWRKIWDLLEEMVKVSFLAFFCH